jgi:hypothetical protein
MPPGEALRTAGERGDDSPVQSVGAAQPPFRVATTDFWARTLTVGFAYRF